MVSSLKCMRGRELYFFGLKFGIVTRDETQLPTPSSYVEFLIYFNFNFNMIVYVDFFMGEVKPLNKFLIPRRINLNSSRG